MLDWQKLVRHQLSGLALDPAEKEEVHAELAGHLEDSCAAFREEGLPEKDAIHRTLAQVSDWRDLQRKISIAKRRVHIMKKRVQQLWIPGFLTLTLSMLFLAALQKLGFRPRIIGSGSGPDTILFYVPWLASLPLFGALGAYVSSRAGGSRRTVLLASTFPAIALTTAFLLMFPIGMIIERVTGNDLSFATVATAVLSDGIGWIVVPGAALLVGGLLTHLLFGGKSSSHNMVVG